jgi:hypothetical protein
MIVLIFPQLNLMKMQVGVEGMFIVVPNNAENPALPEIHWTDPRLEKYMPTAVGSYWNSHHVLTKLNSFAVANLDPSRQYSTSWCPA